VETPLPPQAPVTTASSSWQLTIFNSGIRRAGRELLLNQCVGLIAGLPRHGILRNRLP